MMMMSQMASESTHVAARMPVDGTPRTMSDEATPTKPQLPERSDSSSASSVEGSIPIRPRLQSRKSSGTLIVPRDSSQVGPVDMEFEPGDVRTMSPRRTSEDLEVLGREARAELQKYVCSLWYLLVTYMNDVFGWANTIRRHARALQDSLLMIFNRIEAVKEEHDKLDNNNKFLQKYIGDLMSTSKITSTGRGRK